MNEAPSSADRGADSNQGPQFDVGLLHRAIFNSANFSSIATDAKGVIQIFNVGAETMLGYAAVDVVNKITPADICEPQEIGARARTLSAEMGTHIEPGFDALSFKASRGIEDIYELTYVCKDGSRLPAVVSVTALYGVDDVIIGYLLIGTDNTARKVLQAERMELDQRLRDQHFYTRSLIESNVDALITTDPRGIITDINKQAETLTGCTRDELIGSSFKKHFTDSDRAEECINLVLSEGTVVNYELVACGRNREPTQVSCNASTISDRDRRLVGVFAAARDVTAAKSLEQMLQRKNAELEKSSRIKSEFLANMSHELRTPLNAIIGFSEVLRDGLLGALTEKQRGFVADIFGSGHHLLSLINDILDLSKVEAGKMTLDLDRVPVSLLFSNSLLIVREKAAARKIRLEMNAVEGLGAIYADTRKVKQIVDNLLSNAVKFTSDGGHVTLHASRVPRSDVGQLAGPWTGRVLVTPEHVDDQVAEFLKISVIDNGIGISDLGLQQLFEPFKQIDSGLSRRFEGTGLGLVMVKLLAELHGGGVGVTSAVGEGSCFTVWLPFRTQAIETPLSQELPKVVSINPVSNASVALVVEDDTKEPTSFEQAGWQRTMATILIIENNPANMRFAMFVLESAGHTTISAVDAEAGLILARNARPDLILMDIQLPGIDGLEAIGHLRRDAATSTIPIIALTALAMKGDEDRIRAAGCDGYIAKPIRYQELLSAVAAQLGTP